MEEKKVRIRVSTRGRVSSERTKPAERQMGMKGGELRWGCDELCRRRCPACIGGRTAEAWRAVWVWLGLIGPQVLVGGDVLSQGGEAWRECTGVGVVLKLELWGPPPQRG